jgi:hypothetical protein
LDVSSLGEESEHGREDDFSEQEEVPLEEPSKKTEKENSGRVITFFNSLLSVCFCLQKDKLPASLPRNFPNHTEEDLRVRPTRIIGVGKPQAFSFRDNFVKTSKYEIWNFVPKFLFEEFNPKTKIANIYFLLISCLQMVRTISNTNGVPTTLIPLSFVVVVDACFQILEDLARHKADAGMCASIHLINVLYVFCRLCAHFGLCS